MRLAYAPYRLCFKEPAGTSRGVMRLKQTCFIKVFDEADPSRFGIGEAAVFEGLSAEAGRGYELKLIELLANMALGRSTDLSRHSSIQYGLEQALLNFSSGCSGLYFPSSFTEGKTDIVINGLVWMGDFDTMMKRIDSKVAEGFSCIKLKVGAIDWHSELEMVKSIRSQFSESQLQIRVDANGGFNMDNALPRLKALADLGVHSIEQPIPAGYPELMRFLCEVSPLPIALDEELIGRCSTEEKIAVLDSIAPAFIILKPALCGGFSGAQEWIKLASERNIGWWVTSALESNVGLSALAQWTATLGNPMPQGLGTGQLFTNNFEAPVFLNGEHLCCIAGAPLDHTQFDSLQWRQ
ncbi:MAG: o-succinylbenzoate synthase [Muribaculaceae bacterium]|nr:o-succinylbenzoate synthase [Muribaculaceae bacterium]